MIATAHTDREPWQKLRGNERCEACGHRGYCMYNSSKVYCMFPDGGRVASHTGTDKAGMPYAIYPRTGAAAPDPIPFPRRDERPDWERPDPLACEFLYTTIAERCAGNPPPAAALAADERRFGEHAVAARAASDHFYILQPERLIAWLEREGRTLDAKNAGILVQKKKTNAIALSPALLGRKVYAWRDERGRVKDLRGRAYDGATPKVLSLVGSREERGAAESWYQQRRLADAVRQGGHVRIAGGHEKADALNCAVGATLGANEGQASDGMIAALVDAGIILATVHADGENPKEGKAISEGQRLALALGERLEGAGIAVRIAEPERLTGDPKLDADTILREQGPAALVAIDRAALPLGTYRRRLGLAPDEDLGALVTDLRRQVHQSRAERDQARQDADATRRELIAYNDVLANGAYKQAGRAAIGIAKELRERRRNTTTPESDINIDPETGEVLVRLNLTTAGQRVGLTDDTMGKTAREFERRGLLRSVTLRVRGLCRDRKTGALKEDWITPKFYALNAADAVSWLGEVAALQPDEETKVWGAKPGRPRCERHPDAPTKTTTTRTVTCAECGEILDTTVIGEQFHDKDGQPITPGEVERVLATTSPGASAEEEDLQQPALDLDAPTDIRAWRSAEHLPRCLNYRGADQGCQRRTERVGARYCPGCAAEGYGDDRPDPGDPPADVGAD